MELISDYMRDDSRRHMLNELAGKTFGIDFESWVTQGYFEGDYIPYSFVDEGRIVSNVSANRMKFMQNGSMKYYVQLGTVMTDENYRKQGLAAKLMKHVIEEYEQECDGIYLFGDLSALEFYRKMGFEVEDQYRYHVKDEFCHFDKTKDRFMPVKDMDDEIRKSYLELVRNSAYHSSFEQINKYGLQMFYTAGLDNVFYADDIKCFIVLEQEECAVLQSVLCREKVALADVVRRIDTVDHKCRLGFTPLDEDVKICISEVYDGGDDYRLFYRGEELKSIEQDKLYFPDLSHA
ncbi:Acetyltransferase (GNAT) domain-containing protein [Lachnospiraceae bacterium XBB2008]|nr:Acetyltransferase (GNAT) domain-containing protein [Lachnospiraceae bacterium XBB2008]